MKKVYSILVAYEPELGELEKAIERLLEQTDIVVICNNSKEDVVYRNDCVKIFNFKENLGIAKAQSIGMQWAFDNGADFILQMDQDSILKEGTVLKLVNGYNELTKKGFNIGVIGPHVVHDKFTKETEKARLIKGELLLDKFIKVNHTLSSSSLIPKKAYDKVGGMEDALFIDAVDFEYCWRLKKSGFLTIRMKEVSLEHRVGNGKKKIMGKIDVRIPSPIRHYYHIRNLFLLLWRGYVPIYWKLSNLVKLFLKILLYPFIFDDGIKRVKYMLLGVKDGLLKRYGRIDKASRIR